MIYADQRWIGDHGIGRFARRVLSGLEYSPVSLKTNPASPLDLYRLPLALRNLTSGDLFFSPGYNSPLVCRASVIFTLHDLNHIDTREVSSVAKRIYYATCMKRNCQQAANILTVSEFSRLRIAEWSGTPIDKIINVGCGVDPQYNPEAAPYSFSFPYLLCVSNRKGHKNEHRTIEAFANANLAQDIRLVFTGNPTSELMECIERNKVTQRVQFVGLVPDTLLPSLYRSAQALVFVSLYEGFGLPVLEAMACGIPVVTSNTSALPEVAGDGALLVNPLCVDEIATAMHRILTDTLLRHQLREKGIARATHFSWKKTIGKVQSILSPYASGQD